MVWLKHRVNVESWASNNMVTELKKCQDEWSPRSHRLAQTLRVWLFPRSELSYYSGLVSGPLSSNYCTLMAGPITSRLIVWSLPYVQPAVLLIHPRTRDHHAASTPTSGRGSVSRSVWMRGQIWDEFKSIKKKDKCWKDRNLFTPINTVNARVVRESEAGWLFLRLLNVQMFPESKCLHQFGETISLTDSKKRKYSAVFFGQLWL